MDLDLRVPVGLLFTLLGLIMTVFGFTSDPALYHKSLGINVNVQWGICQLIFGSIMVAFGRSATQAVSQTAVTTHYDSGNPQDAAVATPAGAKIRTRSQPKPRVPHR